MRQRGAMRVACRAPVAVARRLGRKGAPALPFATALALLVAACQLGRSPCFISSRASRSLAQQATDASLSEPPRVADSVSLPVRSLPRCLLRGVLLPPLIMPGVWSGGSKPAYAEESTAQKIIAESRRKAKEDASKRSIFNPNSYKTPTGNYKATDLQSFLPTLYLTRRSFEGVLAQLDDPKANVSDPEMYELLREQNRVEPTRLIRKDAFRTKLWLREKTGIYNAADTEYERMKRALDEQDTQLLLLTRTDGRIEPAAVRVTRRCVEDVIDTLDQLTELVPEDDRLAAKAVADTKEVKMLTWDLVKNKTRRGV